MNIILQEHFFRALNEDYYDSEDIIAKAKQMGAFTELLDSLKAYLEYDDKNKCWVYLRGDVSGRDFYTGVPIQYITDNEKSNLAEDVIEDGVLEYYDWDGLDIDEVKEFMYEDDSLIDSLISALDDDTANLDEHLIEEDCNSIGKSYIKNKKRLKESMKEIDRKYFTSLNKEGDGHYYILKDGNYVKDFYADSDADAKKKFQQYLKKDESLKESLSTTDLVREWYVQAYPTDDLGEYINPQVTFDDVVSALNSHTDIYDVLGAGDSIVRERVFEELAKRLNVEYDNIYYTWIDKKDNIMDESYPVTESLWDMVKGYLEEDLHESFNTTEAIKAVQWMYGYSKKRAQQYIKEVSEQRVQSIIDAFKNNAKKSFYND